MRVPSIGLTPDERRFVREGYQLAERLMRDYRDPPSMLSTIQDALRATQRWLLHVSRVITRN